MKTTIDYSKIDDKTRYFHALADCREYLGDRYTRGMNLMRGEAARGRTDEIMVLQLSFIGVEGYPAEVTASEARTLNKAEDDVLDFIRR